MKTFFCLTILTILAAGCGQDYNSNSGDYAQYSPIEGIDSSSPDGARLLGAYKIFQAKCFSCHTWSQHKSSEQWVSAGLVAKGNVSASQVWTSLKNNNGTMPKDPIAELTSTELATVEGWINGIQ